MYLEKVEIQGFKSFADKTTLTFNRELTAIVGPNGSGKSNTAEAVRWALGEQSLKSLRTKKSEEVIFTGTDKRSRVGLAEVNLYLNNDDGSADIDFREVVITRRLYRSGDSEYLLNNNKVRLQDVQLLLAKANFGQRSYSIIGQGMIDHLVIASPLERKEMFDEATGVRQYQIKKEQAEHKLLLVAENTTASHQVLNELEPRLRSLTRQIKRLEQRELTQKTLIDLQHNYYATLWHKVQQEQVDLEKPIAELTKTIASAEKSWRDQQAEFSKTSRGSSQVSEFADLQNKYSSLQQQKSQILKELALAQSKEATELIRQGKTDQLWLTDQMTTLTHQQTDLKTSAKDLNNLIQQAGDELVKAEQEQQVIAKDLAKAQKDLADLQNKLSQSSGNVDILADLEELQGWQANFLKQMDELDLDQLKKEWEKICAQLATIINKAAPTDQKRLSESSRHLTELIDQLLREQNSARVRAEELRLNKRVAEEKLQFNQDQETKLTAELKKLTALKTGQLVEQASVLEKQLADLEKQLNDLSTKLQGFNAKADEHKQDLLARQQELNQAQQKLNSWRQDLSDQQINLAKVQAHAEDLAKEIAENLGIDWQTSLNKPAFAPVGATVGEKMPGKLDTGEAWAEIQRLKNQLALIGGLEDNVEAEYQEVKERHDFLKQQLTDLDKSAQDLDILIKDLDETIQKKFQTSFQVINQQFNDYFKVLFNGGTAKLTLVAKEETAESDEEDEDEAEDEDKPKKAKTVRYGIEIQATPPGKRLSSINTLSGGEKALTAIALISSIIASNPSPFVILDEVDAALDEANSERFAKIVASLSDKTQFICITHNRATMHHAAILYGVTMGDDGVSKLLSIKLGEAEKMVRQ